MRVKYSVELHNKNLWFPVISNKYQTTWLRIEPSQPIDFSFDMFTPKGNSIR